MALFYLLLTFWTISAFICAHLAKQRGRNVFLWFALGLMFTVFAVLSLFFLPPKEKKKEEPEAASSLRVVKQSASESSFYPENKPTPYSQPVSKRIPTSKTIPWYFINKNLEKVGPLKLPELRKAFVENQLDDSTYIWCEEFDNWMQLSEFQNKTTLTDPDYI